MSMNYVTFNQDHSHLAVGTTKGFRIYTTDPFARCFDSSQGSITLLEMLFSTSLVALILTPRRLQIVNTKRQSTICELTFPTAVLAIRMNRKRLVVVLEDQIYLYDISNLKLLNTIDTSPNPLAICCLSPSSEHCYLAYPLPQKVAAPLSAPPSHAPPGISHVASTTGSVLIFDTLRLEAINVIEAHRSPLSCIAINDAGTLLATASDKGTIIRVFDLPAATKLYQFRRGSMPCRIFNMAFNATSTLLCVTSATDTVHIFKLTPPESLRTADERALDLPAAPAERSERQRSPELARLQVSRTRSDNSDHGSIKDRKHNGTLIGMIRRTSQNVGNSVAASVGAYLPSTVSEMWEPARDFAWLKIPKVPSSVQQQTPLGPTQASRSIVAMSSSSPRVMVVTNAGQFYSYAIDLENGGEGVLVKSYNIGGEGEQLGASVLQD